MSEALVFALNASCGDCLLGPPPSAILKLPPPPMPAFLQQRLDDDAPVASALLLSRTEPCDQAQACEWNGFSFPGAAGGGGVGGKGLGLPGVEYVELPRQVTGAEDDTWFLVLVSCCAGVILLSAILAIVLMRCKQARDEKCVLSFDPSSLDGVGKPSKLVGLSGEVLYPGVDPRALWAALTPSGATQHFVAPAAAAVPVPVPHLQLTQRHLTAPSASPSPPPSPPAEPEYAMPLTGTLGMSMSAGPPPLEPPPPPPIRVAAFPFASHQQHQHPQSTRSLLAATQHGHINKMATLSHAHGHGAHPSYSAIDSNSFDNFALVDSDDQLIGSCSGSGGESYSPSPALTPIAYYHTVGGNRRSSSRPRPKPKVSSPTRIPHPNLPPLNLHPVSGSGQGSTTSSRRSLRRTARRSGSGSSEAHSNSGTLAL